MPNHLRKVLEFNVQNLVVHEMSQDPISVDHVESVALSIHVAWITSHCWLPRSDWQGLIITLEV